MSIKLWNCVVNGGFVLLQLAKMSMFAADLGPMSFIENIVTIYKSLNAAFYANFFQPGSSGLMEQLNKGGILRLSLSLSRCLCPSLFLSRPLGTYSHVFKVLQEVLRRYSPSEDLFAKVCIVIDKSKIQEMCASGAHSESVEQILNGESLHGASWLIGRHALQKNAKGKPVASTTGLDEIKQLRSQMEE